MSGPLCRDHEYLHPDAWFAPAGSMEHNAAKAECMKCPLYWGCQSYALEYGEEYGIFGGMDGETRKRIWRRRPGGKPTRLNDSMDSVLLPALQARREYERLTIEGAS